MTVLDWVLVAVWLGIALSGFWKGAASIVFGIGGLGAGLWLAVLAGADVAASLTRVVEVGWIAQVLGRVLPVVVVSLLSLAAGWGLEKTLEAMRLGWLNRVLGAGLAAVAAAVLLTLLVVTAARISPAWRDLCHRSVIPPVMLGWVGQAPPFPADPPPTPPASD